LEVIEQKAWCVRLVVHPTDPERADVANIPTIGGGIAGLPFPSAIQKVVAGERYYSLLV